MMAASSLYICVALALGLLISTVTRSQLLANQGAILLTYLPSLLLSDFVFPVTNLPRVLQLISSIVPATYYIEILNGIYLKDVGFALLWKDFAVMVLMLAVLSGLSLFILRREGL